MVRRSQRSSEIVSAVGIIAAPGCKMCLGIPVRIVEVHDDAGLTMGVVDFGGVRREVCLAYVQDEVALGSYVIVHVGFAISIVDEAEAHRTFEVLREMSQLDELEWLDEVAEASQALLGSAATARPLIEHIKRTATRSWTMMEVCGGQTHTIVRQGLDELLEGVVEMIHGPGCPVCVTPLEQIDKALILAARPDVIFASFGDMLRVPGSSCDLQQIRAQGGTVRIVYSPLDALELARRHTDREVVFFAVGFETTAPANAMAVWRARQLGVRNFSVLVSHVTVPPAIAAIMAAPDNRVQAFLAAGHVCSVMGWTEYEPLAARYHVPIVVTGFEPIDILEGILMAVRQLETGRAEVENQYVLSLI